MKKLLHFSLLLFVSLSFSQEKFSVSNLSAKLLRQSNSVVIKRDTKIVIDRYNSMSIVENKTVTLLNKKGLNDLDAYAFYDKSTKIKHLSATVYDALGEEIEKFKERDFIDVSSVGSVNLYTDNRVKYLDFTPASYPVTVHFRKEIKTKNTAFIQNFRPYRNYYQSTKEFNFEIENNSGIELRTFENDYMDGVELENKSANHLVYTASHLPSIPKEVYSPSLEVFTPKVMFALKTFELEGERGQASNWKEFGKWRYDNLLQGLDELPESTVKEIQSLTAHLQTDREKAQVVYDYVQRNTRYISVQISIGGWKPISAKEVDEKKYGDCKGLTNYTKALLSAVGIESTYCVVTAGNEIVNIEEEFSSMQGNHVILNIPQEGEDDIWLECTSQDIPFNFLGTFTDNRNVLALKPSGGEILKTPVYSEGDNYQKTSAEINIVENTLKASVEILTKGSQYDNRYFLGNYDRKEVNSHYQSYWKNLKQLTVQNHEFLNKKEEVTFIENLEVEDENYAKIYGNDLILEVNPFNKFQINLPRYSSRKSPFVVERGFVDEDEFVFNLEDLELDVELSDINLDSKYGTYRLDFKLQGKKLIVKRYLKLNKNSYETTEYDKFVDFFSAIARYDNTKLSLKII